MCDFIDMTNHKNLHWLQHFLMFLQIKADWGLSVDSYHYYIPLFEDRTPATKITIYIM